VKTFPAAAIWEIAEKHSESVEAVSDERDNGDGVWFELRAGWQIDDCHAVHEWTAKAARSALRGVRRCYCRGCQYLYLKQIGALTIIPH